MTEFKRMQFYIESKEMADKMESLLQELGYANPFKTGWDCEWCNLQTFSNGDYYFDNGSYITIDIIDPAQFLKDHSPEFEDIYIICPDLEGRRKIAEIAENIGYVPSDYIQHGSDRLTVFFCLRGTYGFRVGALGDKVDYNEFIAKHDPKRPEVMSILKDLGVKHPEQYVTIEPPFPLLSLDETWEQHIKGAIGKPRKVSGGKVLAIMKADSQGEEHENEIYKRAVRLGYYKSENGVIYRMIKNDRS